MSQSRIENNLLYQSKTGLDNASTGALLFFLTEISHTRLSACSRPTLDCGSHKNGDGSNSPRPKLESAMSPINLIWLLNLLTMVPVTHPGVDPALTRMYTLPVTSKGGKCLWGINNCTCYLISQHHMQKLHTPTPFSLMQSLAIRPANDYSSCSRGPNECHLANTKQAVMWHLSGGGLRPATLYLKGMMDGVPRRGQSLLYILSATPLFLVLRCGFGSAVELW